LLRRLLNWREVFCVNDCPSVQLPPLSSREFLQHPLVERLLRQLLEAEHLFLERIEASSLAHLPPAELPLTRVERQLGAAVLPTKICDLDRMRMLLEHANDLLVRQSALWSSQPFVESASI
jgi:hypothetical protein